MLGASSVVVFEALRHMHGSEALIGMTWAGMLAVGGVGITAKNVAVQTLSRGMAWLMAAPMGLVFGVELLKGHRLDWDVGALFATSAAALLLARPALHTKEALAQFNPFRFRRTLLAGSTATAATAFLTGGLTLGFWNTEGLFTFPTIGFAMLTAAMLAVATAVARMRAWGILLGVLTSAALALTGLLMKGADSMWLTMFAAPMMTLHLLPILWARWGAAGTGVRVSSPTEESGTFSAVGPRYRVASFDEELDTMAEEASLPEKRRQAI